VIQTQTIKKTLSQVADAAILNVDGLASLAIDIVGTFVGTVIFEYTINGTDWYTLTGNIVGSSTTATGATAPGKWTANVAAFQKVKVRCSAFTSGAINVVMRAIEPGGSSGSGGSGGGAATVADGADVAEGTTTDAAVITNTTGTISSKLRGLVAILADVWDSTLHKLITALSTDVIYSGTTALTPKFAKITSSSSGNNALVAAVTSKKIRVLAYNFMANGTVNAKFQGDGAGAPADITGLKYCVANVGIVAPFNPLGWFETASGKSLDMNLSAAIAIGGELVYVEV
jgi:hypothetical protein